MDRGTEQPAPGRIPPAVAVVDRDGLVSHWSRGAHRLFALAEEDAIGRPALDLLPVSGALPDEDDDAFSGGSYAAHGGPGPDLEPSLGGRLSHPVSGRARLTVPGSGRVGLLWWAYPLAGPGPGRLLVLAADEGELRPADPAGAAVPEPVVPGFAPHTDFPGAEEQARRLPESLPGLSAGEGARVVAQVLELGCPVVEFGQGWRVSVTFDTGPPWTTPANPGAGSASPRPTRPSRPRRTPRSSRA